MGEDHKNLSNMKIVYNNIIPFKGFIAINLFGVLFVRKELKSYVKDEVINHEMIHTKQMIEMGYILFYIWYIIEYLIRLCSSNKKTAYYDISFEREAYENEDFTYYIKTRKKYSWIKYIK